MLGFSQIGSHVGYVHYKHPMILSTMVTVYICTVMEIFKQCHGHHSVHHKHSWLGGQALIIPDTCGYNYRDIVKPRIRNNGIAEQWNKKLSYNKIALQEAILQCVMG